MKIDANETTVAAVKQMTGLDAKEPLTLELVLEHGAVGHPIDVEYVSDLLRGVPLTLANVREYMSKAVEEKAVLVSQAVRAEEQGVLSDDDIAEHILIHCPYEVRTGWKIALEQHPQLNPLQIMASVLIANRDNLHAGDTVLLTPTDKLPVARGGIPRNQGFAPQTCASSRCSLPFVPKRSGQKYGCEACGRYAHREFLWSKRRDDARRADQTFIEPHPEYTTAQDGICQCGQGTSAQVM